MGITKNSYNLTPKFVTLFKCILAWYRYERKYEFSALSEVVWCIKVTCYVSAIMITFSYVFIALIQLVE